MKLPILISIVLFASSIEATKMAPETLPNLGNFFATKNLQDIENKINSTSLFTKKEAIGSQEAFEEAVYNIAFKKNRLTLDEKTKIFKLLKEKAEGKSKDIQTIVKIGSIYVSQEKSREKHKSSAENIASKKIEFSPENQALGLALSFNNLPAVKLSLKHGANPNQTNALSVALGLEDLAIAKYLLAHGADPEGSKNAWYYYGPGDPIKNPEDNKFYLHYRPIALFAGLVPRGEFKEKPVKLLLDAGVNINKIGYYKTSEESKEKQGTLLDLFYDAYELVKKAAPEEGMDQKAIDESLQQIERSITMLKKYGAKRSADLKK